MTPTLPLSIIDFMKIQKSVCIELINKTNKSTFDSHEFIQLFMKRFEIEYVVYLALVSVEPFRIVNSNIAKYLSNNQEDLGIIRCGKIRSTNVFGEMTENEKWKKLVD